MDDSDSLLYRWPSVSAAEINRSLQIPLRRIKQYVDLDMVKIREKSPGVGNSRRFTLSDVMLILLFDRLEALGMTPKRISRIADRLAEALELFFKADADPGFRYVHVTANSKGVFVGHTATTNVADWASILIDLSTLHSHFQKLIKKQWTTKISNLHY